MVIAKEIDLVQLAREPRQSFGVGNASREPHQGTILSRDHHAEPTAIRVTEHLAPLPFAHLEGGPGAAMRLNEGRYVQARDGWHVFRCGIAEDELQRRAPA